MNLNWVEGLTNPLGMTIHNDELFVAERKNIARTNLNTGEVVERTEVPGSVFLNDIAIDQDGSIYISDSRKNVIWIIEDNSVEEWLVGEEVLDPNVLYINIPGSSCFYSCHGLY